MAKLYPPTIPGALPATIANSTNRIMEIPFTLNKSVGISDIIKIRIKVKSVTENRVLGTKDLSISSGHVVFSQDGKSGIAKFIPGNVFITEKG